MPREYTKMKHLEATVFEMKDAGKTNAQIGEELGLTKAQIKGLVKRYNRKSHATAEEDAAAPDNTTSGGTPSAAVKKKASSRKGDQVAHFKQDAVPMDARAPALKQSIPEKPIKEDTPAVKTPQRAVVPVQPAEVIKAEFVLRPATILGASPRDMQQALHSLQEEMDVLEGAVHEIDRMWSRLEKSRKALNAPSERQ